MIRFVLLFVVFFCLLPISGIQAKTDFPETLNHLAHSKQALIVDPIANSLFKARVTAWQKEDQQWDIAFDPLDAVAGKNGFAPESQKREGDGKTPSGIFYLRTAFGYFPSLETKMNYRQVGPGDVWVDDPDSKDYNRLKNVKELTDARSFEKMRRDDNLYQAGVVIEYNTQPVVPGLGSAIFLHIWRGFDEPTAGCVALSEESVLKILKWLDPSDNPVIIIDQ